MPSPVSTLPLHRRIVPPIYLLAALFGMLALHHTLPLARLEAPLLRWLGGIVMIGGVALSAAGAGTFRRAGTPVRPFEEATTLVTTGPYRWTRNPMYLGMLLVLAGTGIALASLTPLVVIPAFFLLIRNGFIRHEEAAMAECFGDQFTDYCGKVRRWI